LYCEYKIIDVFDVPVLAVVWVALLQVPLVVSVSATGAALLDSCARKPMARWLLITLVVKVGDVPEPVLPGPVTLLA